MRTHVFATILLLLTGCNLGGSKESHSSALDSTSYSICNEDGTVNDLSTSSTTEAPTDETPIEVPADSNPIEAPTDSADSTVADTTTGISPAVPNDGIGVLKYATMDIGQAEECELNHNCRILTIEGEKASVEHCGNVTIVVLPKRGEE